MASGLIRGFAPPVRSVTERQKDHHPIFPFFPSLYDVVKAHEHSYPPLLCRPATSSLNMGSNASYPLARLAGVAMHDEEASSSDLERLRRGFLPPFFPRRRAWLLIVVTCVEKGRKRGPSSFTKLKPSSACRQRTGICFFFFFLFVMPHTPLIIRLEREGRIWRAPSCTRPFIQPLPGFPSTVCVWCLANSKVTPTWYHTWKSLDLTYFTHSSHFYLFSFAFTRDFLLQDSFISM